MTRSDSKAAGIRQPAALPSSPKTAPCPDFPHHGIGMAVELGSFGFSEARPRKVTLVKRHFCGFAK